MLTQLSLKNIAIIESLEVLFHRGLTVITGETGAGKSILLDAISLAFGARVSPREVVRTGCERASVELLFDLAGIRNQERIRTALAELGVSLLADETEILLSREFTLAGSRSRVNGVPVNRDALETLRPWMLDLHGQHELTSLFHKDDQRRYLDALGGPSLQAAKKQVQAAYTEWVAVRSTLKALQDQQQTFQQRRDFLEYQCRELNEAGLTTDDEDTLLQQELQRLTHAEGLIQATQEAAFLLNEGEPESPALVHQLGKIQKLLAEPAQLDEHLQVLLEKLEGVSEELKELAGSLGHYSQGIETTPERIQQVVERLDLLEKLKRKYGPSLAQVLATFEEVQRQLSEETHAGESLAGLEARLQALELELQAVCAVLTAERRQAAERLKADLTEQLQALCLPSVLFDIDFQSVAYQSEGAEEVEFLFSANPGEPLRPLAKVASGGELSRFLLGLKVLTAASDGVETLIFDEIDTGISGPTARAVAEKLATLSKTLQVLVITHQPMVAAMGDCHLHVQKTVVEMSGIGSVRVEVLPLEEEGKRLKVLSRLVSGTDTSDETVEKFIERLRTQAGQWKKSQRIKPVATIRSR